MNTNDQLATAARGILLARDAQILTEMEWEALAEALDGPDPAGGVGGKARYVRDGNRLVRLVERGGVEAARQLVATDKVRDIVDALEGDGDSHTVEGLREHMMFFVDRSSMFAALEFLVHIRAAVRGEDGCYAAAVSGIEASAADAIKALPTK